MRKIAPYFRLTAIIFTLVVGLTACGVNYSFSGVNISEEVLTYSVDFFPNRAALVQAQLSQLYTDALMDKIQGNTNLEYLDYDRP